MPVKSWRTTTLAAIDSIQQQTLGDFEFLIVGQEDTNSLEERLPSDPRIRCIARNQPGIVGALNTGLSAARGQWLARMDDDDLALPTRLDTQLHFLESNRAVQLSGAVVRLIDQHGQRGLVGAGNKRYESWLNSLVTPESIYKACFIENPLPHPTLFAHRDTWQRLKGYRDGDWPEDLDLVLRAWQMGLQMGKPDDTLLEWREHETRLTWQDTRYRREAFIQLKANIASQAQSGFGLDKGRPVWLCGTGRNARYWFDALLANNVTVNGFVDLDRPGARQHKRHRPVITYSDLWQQRSDAFIVTAFSDPAARKALRAEFDQRGLAVYQDYLLGG